MPPCWTAFSPRAVYLFLSLPLFWSQQRQKTGRHRGTATPGRLAVGQRCGSTQGERGEKRNYRRRWCKWYPWWVFPESLTADVWIKQRDQELMTNSSQQSSLIIPITWVNACNHGLNCCSEEGSFQWSVSVSRKRVEEKNDKKLQIFALISLQRIHLCLVKNNPLCRLFWVCSKNNKETKSFANILANWSA